MKKIIAILFVLINTLLFFNIREAYMEKDVSDVARIHYFDDDVVHASLIISNPGNEMMDESSSAALFDVFSYITQKFEIMIMYGEVDFNTLEHRYYLFSATPIDNLLGLVTNVSLNFNNQDDYFYTNHANRENGIQFFLLNQRLDVNILPMRMMGTIRGGQYTFVARSQTVLDESIAFFMSDFENYVDTIRIYDSDPLDTGAMINTFLTSIILLNMILIFLVIILYIHLNTKKLLFLKQWAFHFLT